MTMKALTIFSSTGSGMKAPLTVSLGVASPVLPSDSEEQPDIASAAVKESAAARVRVVRAFTGSLP